MNGRAGARWAGWPWRRKEVDGRRGDRHQWPVDGDDVGDGCRRCGTHRPDRYNRLSLTRWRPRRRRQCQRARQHLLVGGNAYQPQRGLRLSVGAQRVAASEINRPCGVRRTQERRLGPERRSRGARKLGLVDGRQQTAGLDEPAQLMQTRQAPAGLASVLCASGAGVDGGDAIGSRRRGHLHGAANAAVAHPALAFSATLPNGLAGYVTHQTMAGVDKRAFRQMRVTAAAAIGPHHRLPTKAEHHPSCPA